MGKVNLWKIITYILPVLFFILIYLWSGIYGLILYVSVIVIGWGVNKLITTYFKK